MGIRIVAMVAMIATVAGLAPALAADPAGEAIAVTPAAAASGAAGSRTLATHGSVYMGDLVTTDAGGQAQLKFRDDTRMIVGPNSQLTIDKFVYAGDGTAKQVTFEATRGVFRFITGNSPKPAYLIDTPVATIGARGSHGDIHPARRRHHQRRLLQRERCPARRARALCLRQARQPAAANASS